MARHMLAPHWRRDMTWTQLDLCANRQGHGACPRSLSSSAGSHGGRSGLLPAARCRSSPRPAPFSLRGVPARLLRPLPHRRAASSLQPAHGAFRISATLIRFSEGMEFLGLAQRNGMEVEWELSYGQEKFWNWCASLILKPLTECRQT